MRWQTPLKFNTKCWILHPRYLGVVVAKGIVSVNKISKSLATPGLPTLCGEFSQMVIVTKVHQHGTPCLSPKPKHLPRATTLDVACVGLTCKKTYIQWACTTWSKNELDTLHVWTIPTQPCAIVSILRVAFGLFECGKVIRGF